MNHPGYSSPKLADMRRVLDEETLSDRDRRAVQSALGEIEAEWQERHRRRYQETADRRDELHTEVLDVAGEFIDLINEWRDDVRNGRRSAKEVRAKLRDARADFEKLTQQHQGIERREHELEELGNVDLAKFQADQFARFPHTLAGQVTLGQKITEKLQQPSRHEVTGVDDTDHEAIARELGRPAPGRFPAARRHGWSPR